jgi:hypothetical protein
VTILLAVSAVLATVANPHLFGGGGNDLYGLVPWWQSAGAATDLVVVVLGALLWHAHRLYAKRMSVGMWDEGARVRKYSC